MKALENGAEVSSKCSLKQWNIQIYNTTEIHTQTHSTILIVMCEYYYKIFVLATDINECYEGTHNCDPLANCVDTDGSYTCECRIGYTGTGWACSSKYTAHHKVENLFAQSFIIMYNCIY